jgi:hypothetical protein
MPRAFLDDWKSGQVLAWTVTRGKCSHGDSHESVRLVDGEWWGETTNDTACPYAPEDQCVTCAGRGFHEVRGQAAEQLALDGHPVDVVGGEKVARKPCPPCRGSGYQPGPHWPWRWPQPPPLRVRD